MEVGAVDKYGLQKDILEILVVTIFESAYGSGHTYTEIMGMKDRAVSRYFSDPKFNAVVQRQTALIMECVERRSKGET
jgi:hypothetical protein